MFVKDVPKEGSLVESDPCLGEVHLDIACNANVQELVDFLEQLVSRLGTHQHVIEHEDSLFTQRIEDFSNDVLKNVRGEAYTFHHELGSKWTKHGH